MHAVRSPNETNPPLVLKSSKGSPLNSGGGMGDHVQGGALAQAAEHPTSMSSCMIRPIIRKVDDQNVDIPIVNSNNETYDI